MSTPSASPVPHDLGTPDIAPALRPNATRGWRRGFSPMLRKELGQWWGTRRWLVQVLTWLVLINGVVALMMVLDPAEDALTTFVLLGMLTTAVGAIVTTQGAVIGEKQRGTAAWVLSKPVTRASFLVSKLTAYAIGFAVVALAVPFAAFQLETWLIAGQPAETWSLLGAMGLWALHLLFYLALMISLGTVFNSRGPVAAVGIGVVLTGQFFGGMVPLPVLTLTPWILPELAKATAHGEDVSAYLPQAVGANLALVLVATAVGLWRLSRQEL